MSMLSDIRSLFVPPLRMAGTAEPALASRAVLDGRNFDGRRPRVQQEHRATPTR